MQREYSYKGYAIQVSTESISAPALRMWHMSDSGYVATVSIYKTNDSSEPMTQMRLTDLNDRWFINDVDALMRGYSVGRRIVDEAFAKRKA
ncbi:hypothetical protein [Paraburkholderia bannensis]|uniref:hypothetical protein n=1 Tax=Paraburkholderia bannensis TaxID=765414 RepID=UPI002ABD3C45|nr:hypothetical protein [Paraburkholderia bannensis]